MVTHSAACRAAWRPSDFQAGWVENNITLTPTALPRRAVANGFQLTAANLKTLALDSGRMKIDTTKEQPRALDLPGRGMRGGGGVEREHAGVPGFRST
jgi:hypothetical protein